MGPMAFGFGARAALAGWEEWQVVKWIRFYRIKSENLIQPQFDASAQFTGNLFYGWKILNLGTSHLNREIGVSRFRSPFRLPKAGVESDLPWYLSPGMEVHPGSTLRIPRPLDISTTLFFTPTIRTSNAGGTDSVRRRVPAGPAYGCWE